MRLNSRKAFATVSIAVCAAGVAASVALWPRPAQLSVPGAARNDTITVNTTHPTRLRVFVLDQYGRRLPSDTAVRFRLISGASIKLSAPGKTTCTRSEDALVQATFVGLAKDFVLHCRPIVSLEGPSWMDFVVGDSPRDLSFLARGPDGVAVTELRGSVTILDGSIAELIGNTVRPKRPGQTTVIVAIGDKEARISVLVYRSVTSFVNSPPNERLLAMRVRLAQDDTVELPLPKAVFWVKYFSTDRGAAPPTIKLRGNGSCTTGDGIHLQRVEDGEYAKYCFTGDGATMMIAHGEMGAKMVNGTIALDVESR
jgi:hypothetical protein